jgi:hypothetical protein
MNFLRHYESNEFWGRNWAMNSADEFASPGISSCVCTYRYVQHARSDLPVLREFCRDMAVLGASGRDLALLGGFLGDLSVLGAFAPDLVVLGESV